MQDPFPLFVWLLLLLLTNPVSPQKASATTPPSPLPQPQPLPSVSPLSEDVLRSVSAYVKHKLTWSEEDYPRWYRRQCTQAEAERYINASLIRQRELLQARFAIVEAAINRCPRPSYLPRTLGVNQISWKSRPKQTSNVTSGAANSTAAAGSPLPLNATTDLTNGNSSINNSSCSSNSTTSSSNSTSHEVVHKYLVFVLLLPQHPFSYELLESVTVIAPLFPHITVVVGSAYEFRDFCSQYNVKAFPKLLFFRRGLLKHKYKSHLNPWSLAYQLAKWTNSLPVASPEPAWPHQWKVGDETEDNITGAQSKGLLASLGVKFEMPSSFLNISRYSFGKRVPTSPSSSTTAKVVEDTLRVLSARVYYMLRNRSFEPFAGTSEILAREDFRVVIVSGVFVMSRGLFSAWRLFNARRA